MTAMQRKDREFIQGMISGKQKCAWISYENAKHTGLTRKDIRTAISFTCPFLGLKLQYWLKGPDYASLVKIDEDGEFIPGNIITVSKAYAERNMT